mmetsp:Transcript_43327/g.94362  ORF Transcript_43327/g.94362 Transcript_43327/m.94362 type:complete len:80 (-) Transcript_43327:28-267(-)
MRRWMFSVAISSVFATGAVQACLVIVMHEIAKIGVPDVFRLYRARHGAIGDGQFQVVVCSAGCLSCRAQDATAAGWIYQ